LDLVINLKIRISGIYVVRYIPIILLAGILVSGCGSDDVQTGKQPGLEVEVLKVTARDTPVSIEFVAKTASSRKVEIRSRVEGFLEELAYQEGSMVDEGQVLFQMDRKPFQARLDAAKAELSQQQARLQNANANLKRVKPLAEKNAVAQKELDDALGTYLTAAAAVEQAKANVVQAELDLGYTTITSPLLGVSSYAVKREGAYIGLGGDSLLTYVAQIDPMWIEFSVSENQILRGREDEARGILVPPEDGSYEVEIVLADGMVYPIRGRITFADASLSEETGTFLIRAEIANPEKSLRPGQFVRANLLGAVRPNAILVPQQAVQQGAKGSFVWVIKEDGTAEFRPIEIGPWHEDQWFIERGLKDGETVVVKGGMRLQANMPVRIISGSEDKQKQESKADKP
jgi:membrane fusion protein (multidrug efflux system)